MHLPEHAFWHRILHHDPATAHPETVMSESATVAGIISTVESILPLLVAGKLSRLNTEFHANLSKFDVDADAKLASLQTALDKFETGNPMAQQIVGAVLSIVKATGVQMPSEAQVFLALKTIVDTAISMAKPAPAAA